MEIKPCESVEYRRLLPLSSFFEAPRGLSVDSLYADRFRRAFRSLLCWIRIGPSEFPLQIKSSLPSFATIPFGTWIEKVRFSSSSFRYGVGGSSVCSFVIWNRRSHDVVEIASFSFLSFSIVLISLSILSLLMNGIPSASHFHLLHSTRKGFFNLR